MFSIQTALAGCYVCCFARAPRLWVVFFFILFLDVCEIFYVAKINWLKPFSKWIILGECLFLFFLSLHAFSLESMREKKEECARDSWCQTFHFINRYRINCMHRQLANLQSNSIVLSPVARNIQSGSVDGHVKCVLTLFSRMGCLCLLACCFFSSLSR